MNTDVQPIPSPSDSSLQSILLVDDNPTNLGVLFEALAQSGFRLLVAEDGEAALEQIQYGCAPDIILLDVMMPRMDGFETCRRLKANPATRDIPIIFMTALSDTVNKVEGLSIGGVDYITKPIQPDEVLARVRVHLKIHALQEQLKEQNQTLHQEVQDRKRAEQSLKLLVQAVSHDLKNPMTGMLMVLRNLLQTAPPTPDTSPSVVVKRTLLERMVDSAEHQLNLINSLLDVHSLDTSVEVQASGSSSQGAIALNRQRLHFDRLVANVVQDMEPFLGKYQGTLHNHVPPGLSPVYGDPNQLWRVLENLITNAIKHNPPGITITITAEPLDSHVLCRIQDDGKGIPIEEQKTLFDPYRRGSTRTNTPGLGLGLYLCRQIIHAHGGTIHLISEPGEGSIFQFTLPLLNASADMALRT